ncbi:dTDP-4-dehydrorhamnose reductase [Agrobacterium larrymoorei]|uniref:dTDP-4-dehydrorhamnose reductase n=1 Tax=Agrobacterium larrymoorei TaxID=160699 RepID=A0AAF0HCY4_9HYPH|nr:dTDP-4-dehydrorhamnose reductase [Agrobacterium larrymoorei]WHA42033.1 dTDP-4-dehydrorhamnose reductase [Agrobacterium larrymoorei]
MAVRYVTTGCTGQVVTALVELSRQRNDIEVVALGRPQLDLSVVDTIEKSLLAARPDLIISTAAYTAVDQAESQQPLAYAVNSQAIGLIGETARKIGVPVIHLSTDYVFDGTSKSAYTEAEITNPINVYGRSKREGERKLISSGADHAILRTSWVYSTYGKNFLKTMLNLATNRDEISVVSDQRGSPTSALDLADGVLSVAKNMLSSANVDMRGIFHLCGQGATDWATFAEEIFSVSRKIGGPYAKVRRITTAEFPTPARRPPNSCLNCQKIDTFHGVRLPDWKASVQIAVKKLIQ